jgi:tetratricopeptide (TPR) repeat protein
VTNTERVPTTLTARALTLLAASLGPENPLPPLGDGAADLHKITELDHLPPDMRDNITYGALPSVLPCLEQDGYDRDRRPRDLPSLVLENDHLVATVLPGLGGRLYSLVDKASGEELLYRNPVFQPANLALRNAWFAGGVEWNLGSTGHWTGTCSPLHAGRVDGPDGTPMLRLWEWERSRGLVMQVDFWLPDDSAWLFVGVRVRNPRDEEVPAYWWSNIAVPQTPGSRVIAPADQAWHFGYTTGGLDLIGVPSYQGFDLSYPMRHPQAADFFFELGDDQPRPWICSLDETGAGLVQLSTGRLRGRKLFVWGEGDGGHRWQEWLAPGAEGHGYAEIQAGLARTQLEHLRMPADADWSWLEAYGRLSVDPAAAHDPNWGTARAAAEDVLDSLLPATELAAAHDRWRPYADQEPAELLAEGSGWGALEGPTHLFPGTPFPTSAMTREQLRWLALVTSGAMPDADPLDPPGGTLVAPVWRAGLEVGADSWLVWYHRGVARWYAGDRAGAVKAWQASLAAAESPWALRNLAVAARVDGDTAGAAELYLRALRLLPDLLPLAVEAVALLQAADRHDDVVKVLAGLPDAARADGRLRLAEARTSLARGDAAAAERVLDAGIELVLIREGGNDLADLWREVQQALGTDRPVPAAYQFGMSG